MTADNVVSEVGVWWPSADEDDLRRAAAAWRHMADALHAAASTGRAGASEATAHWSGQGADRFTEAWQSHEKLLNDDAGACLALEAALLSYADAVTEAKHRIAEIAGTVIATIVAGVGLAWLTFGVSAAAAGEVTAGLVAAAAAVEMELSSTVAAVAATALVGTTFGAGEAALVDVAATQQVRVQLFHDGRYSPSEVADSASAGALTGGPIGGAVGYGAVRPMARIAAGDLSGVRAPGGRIRAALDPTNWGPQGSRFQVGVHIPLGVKFEPHEIDLARYAADRGGSVHLKRPILVEGTKNPDALVRYGRNDPGTYTEFKTLRGSTYRSVMRGLRDGHEQLEGWGGGEVVIDGRPCELSESGAREGIERAVKAAKTGGDPLPERATIILGDGRKIRLTGDGISRVD